MARPSSVIPADGKFSYKIYRMINRKILKIIHITSTAWFIICVGYIFVLALRQAGIKWWVVFSLSGHGALVAFVLISLYLFAIFRGISSSQKVHLEHSLTSTTYYAFFYVCAPFLGTLASCIGMIGVNTVSQFILGIAMGTLGTTFLVWVIVDPGIGLLEMLLPASRKHRARRLVLLRKEREEKQKQRDILLTEVVDKEEQDKQRWKEILRQHAEELSGLLSTDNIDNKKIELNAVNIGAKAWQIGGISCMRELRDMAISIYKQKNQNKDVVDYISFWWDGIGTWKAPSLCYSK